MFTHDSKFRVEGLTTRRRVEINANYKCLLDKYQLTPDQVAYIESDRCYVAESPALLREYFTRFPAPQGSVIISDGGKAFYSGGVSVLQSCGVSRNETLPPLVHQYLSPNDNHHHGAAKAKWRSKCASNGWGKDDSIESSLCLLSFLTHVPPEDICGYFTKNMCLDVDNLNAEICTERISDGNFSGILKNRFFKICSTVFKQFEETGEINDCLPVPKAINEIDCTLDGPYWSKF